MGVDDFKEGEKAGREAVKRIVIEELKPGLELYNKIRNEAYEAHKRGDNYEWNKKLGDSSAQLAFDVELLLRKAKHGLDRFNT